MTTTPARKPLPEVRVERATYTAHEAALLAGVSADTLYRMCKDETSDIPHRRIRGRLVFPKHRFASWLEGES